MSSEVVGGLVLVIVGLVGVLGGLGHWRGWVQPRGPIEPRSWTGRFYVTWPIWAALVSFGLVILSDTVLDAEWLALTFLVAMAMLMLVGMVAVLWQPEWFRPAWQRRHVRLSRARKALMDDAAERGHHLIVLLTVEDDEEPIASAATEETAVALAQQSLAERSDADAATVLDVAHERIVRTIEREVRERRP